MMMTTPIRTLEEIEQMKSYFLSRNRIRDYALFVTGINTALRISDLLQLRWMDIYDSTRNTYRRHMDIYEQKTQKHAEVALNESCIKSFKLLRQHSPFVYETEYLFCHKCNHFRHISRNRAYHIIKDAAAINRLDGNISCHSLRKTFGYHAWKKGTPSALIMNIYNHSSMEITKRYLSISQDDKDELYRSMNL